MALSERDAKILSECADTDEPVFVFRGKDIFSASIIAQYETQARKHGPDNPDFLKQVAERRREFERWQQVNTKKVRYPD